MRALVMFALPVLFAPILKILGAKYAKMKIFKPIPGAPDGKTSYICSLVTGYLTLC